MVTLSWRDIDGFAYVLTRALASCRPDAIVGVARSGLIPAVMLSHSLGVRAFGSIEIRRTLSDDLNAAKHDPVVQDEQSLQRFRGQRVLLVDDIVGAGATMRAARALFRTLDISLTTAALVVNQSNLGEADPATVVDYHACVVHGWVVFPWEGKSWEQR